MIHFMTKENPMVSFKEYQSYKINTDNAELFSQSRFQFVKKGDVVNERTFIELMEFLKLNKDDKGHVKEYEIDADSFGIDSITILIGKDTHFIRAEAYQLGILKTILTSQKLAKSGWGFWSWYFVEGNDNHLDSKSSTFFVCEGDEILEDQIILYDIPENLFQDEYPYPDDPDPDELLAYHRNEPYQRALVRKNYENFFENTPFGKLVIAKSKNETDLKAFGAIQPSADKIITPTFLMPKMESVIKELKDIKLILIIGFLLLAVVIYMSR